MSHLEEKLSLAVDLSNQIIRLGQQEDWPQMKQLDHRRMRILEAVLSDVAFDVEDGNIKGQLQSITQLNKQALELCSQSKEAMLADNRKLRRGKEAISAYHKQHLAY